MRIVRKNDQKCIVSETQETAVTFHINEEEEESDIGHKSAKSAQRHKTFAQEVHLK